MAKDRINVIRKILVLIITMAMIMMMSNTAFAAVHMSGSNFSELHRHSTYADAGTTTGITNARCLVIVTAFSGNGGQTNYADAIASAYTDVNAPGTSCTKATSSHRVYETGLGGSVTYYSHTLEE